MISVSGPYLADGENDDPSIMKHIMQTDAEEILGWLENEEISIVGRGIRNCQEFLSLPGIECKMSSMSQKTQPTPDESNSSCMETNVRWVVE